MRNIWLLQKVAREALGEIHDEIFVNQEGLDQAVKIIADITRSRKLRLFGIDGICPAFDGDIVDGKMQYHIVCLWLRTQNTYLKVNPPVRPY
jgi:hypothetical protein